MTQHFLIGAYDSSSPICADGKTLKDARRAKAWQGVAGQTEHIHICTPHPTNRGTFVSVDTGAALPTTRGAMTEEAYASMLTAIWG